jgi:hypothetical protein
MGSSISKAGTESDGFYRKQLYFDPEADESDGSVYWIDDADILTTVRRIADVDEKILEVSIYRHPLYFWQVFKLVTFVLNFLLFTVKIVSLFVITVGAVQWDLG